MVVSYTLPSLEGGSDVLPAESAPLGYALPPASHSPVYPVVSAAPSLRALSRSASSLLARDESFFFDISDFEEQYKELREEMMEGPSDGEYEYDLDRELTELKEKILAKGFDESKFAKWDAEVRKSLERAGKKQQALRIAKAMMSLLGCALFGYAGWTGMKGILSGEPACVPHGFLLCMHGVAFLDVVVLRLATTFSPNRVLGFHIVKPSVILAVMCSVVLAVKTRLRRPDDCPLALARLSSFFQAFGFLVGALPTFAVLMLTLVTIAKGCRKKRARPKKKR